MKKYLPGLLACAVVLGWAVWGVHGAVVYGNNYYRFRGFPPPRTPKGVPNGRLVHVNFFSPALGQRRSYFIFLPPGYAAAAAHGRRFPVYYFLHGSPGTPTLVFNAGRIGVEYDILIHRHRIRPFLMVMPDGRNGTFRSDTEWANTRRGGKYASFVMDVVHAVDSRWATIPRRQDRMIAGNSEGAYGALNLALHDIGTFGSLQSWSGYTSESATSGPFAGAPASVIRANEPNLYLPRVAATVKRHGLHAYLYTGAVDPWRHQVIAFAHQLRAAGAKVSFSMWPGGHNWRLWRDHIGPMLEWASRVLGR